MNDEKEVKKFLEQITGSELDLKKVKRNEDDFKRSLFETIIISIEKVNNRSWLMEKDFEISHFKYDESFHEIIDSLIMLAYGEEATNLILFYLYERVNPDGSINSLLDEENKPIMLNNPTELYYMVKALTEAKRVKKKK